MNRAKEYIKEDKKKYSQLLQLNLKDAAIQRELETARNDIKSPFSKTMQNQKDSTFRLTQKSQKLAEPQTPII